MAPLGRFGPFFLLSLAASWPPSESSPDQVVHRSHGSHGVFMVIEGGEYTLNFTAADAACSSLNVTMATRGQVARALPRGLETCKFGWIAERLVVVPRRTSDSKCGRGKTGLVEWSVPLDRKFAVYCFNASAITDLDKTLRTSTARSPSTSLAPLTQTSAPPTPLFSLATESPPSARPMSPTFAPLVQTPGSTWSFSSHVTSFERLHSSVSPDQLFTSGPPLVPLSSSTSRQASNSPVSSEPVQPESGSSAKHFLGGVVATTLILLGVIVLVLAAAGVVWRHKLKKAGFCWCERRQEDDAETEMWKQTNSEMDLRSEHGAEVDLHDEELDRKYSSDVTLCVNPLMKAVSSE